MNKEVAEKVIERSEGLCEICHSSNMVELHHIVGGHGKRSQHETVESVIALCWEHHHGTFGVEGREGGEFKKQLKRQVQEAYIEQGYSDVEVMRMMGGKLY